ncbi:hypothetical protein [Streptomyces hawaiiensis]
MDRDSGTVVELRCWAGKESYVIEGDISHYTLVAARPRRAT